MWDYGEERALFCTRSEVKTNHDEKQGHGGLDCGPLRLSICGCVQGFQDTKQATKLVNIGEKSVEELGRTWSSGFQESCHC